PIADFFVDAEAGALPNVVLVDPSYSTGFRMDDHPLGDMRVAQKFASNIVRALQSSPQWHRTAMFITYDEWGGFFDHVRPPLQPDVQTDMAFSPLPEVPLESTPCQGYWFQDVPVVDQPDRDGALKPFGLSWEGAELWLDRVGYKARAGTTVRELLNP